MLAKRFVLALAALTLGAGAPRAAPNRDDLAATSSASGLEVIAFEAPGCRYCDVLKRDVLPSYAGTPNGKAAPLRFLDVNDPAAQTIKLNGPITMVPTIVVARDGVELGRIDGYVGREALHRMLALLLPSH